LLRKPPPHAPDSVTIYSNAGYIMAGAMLEIVTGEPWEALVTREVFRPLGMSSAGFGAPGGPGPLRQARGHRRDGTGFRPVDWGPNADNPRVTGPAGSVHASLADWGRFVAAHLRGARGDTTYLPRRQWERLHTAGGAGWDYTPGWKRVRDGEPNGVTLQHLGSNGFWLAQASLALDRGYAVLLTANASDDILEKPFGALLRSLSEAAPR
ncbi:MAG TPA: serine hydrolase domain-containing protein, partial [Longimicrobium sp.]